MEKYLYKIDIEDLSANPNAISLLEQNMDNIDWEFLSKNPNAIPLLEKNIDNIDWYELSSNPNAINILEKNIDNIKWIFLSENINAIHLFTTLDYIIMKESMKDFYKELCSYVFHPDRLSQLAKKYNMSFSDLLNYY